MPKGNKKYDLYLFYMRFAFRFSGNNSSPSSQEIRDFFADLVPEDIVQKLVEVAQEKNYSEEKCNQILKENGIEPKKVIEKLLENQSSYTEYKEA